MGTTINMTILSVANRIITTSSRKSNARIVTSLFQGTNSSNIGFENKAEARHVMPSYHKIEISISSQKKCNLQQTNRQIAFYSSSSDNSHSDFAPKRKSIEGDDVQKMIHEHVTNNKIMLYMKGTPNQPQCGFSMRVVQVLQSQGVDFSSVNVLDYPQIREGVKKYSEWPTIPQLYVDGEFVGGCDIIMNMHDSGELSDLFKEKDKN